MKSFGMKGLILITVLCSIVVKASQDAKSYDPAELLSKIFNGNVTSRQRGYGLFRFEDQPQVDQYDDPVSRPLRFGEDSNPDAPIRFEDSNRLPYNQEGDRPLRFEDDTPEPVNQGVQFQDNNNLENQGNKRKRKRRRRPKKYGLQGQGGRPAPGYGTYGYAPMYASPGYFGVPMRRRRPSNGALSAVTEALTSIARYDDLQCVPRLLCEAAGRGALGAGVLDSVAGIQPLLTLLSAYNGLSSSPLFVFGRAVFMGMTSKGTSSCLHAYPQCPTDPEQLIHYLNNHNGGFFRFFGNPTSGQNLEQFYQQLGQHGGNQGEQFGGNQFGGNQFGYNQYYQNQDQFGGNQYGPYQFGPAAPNNFGPPLPGPQNYGYQTPNLYGNQNYGENYALGYNTYNNNIRYKDLNKIQKRIQNKPNEDVDDNFDDFNDVNNGNNSKFAFPNENSNEDYDNGYLNDEDTNNANTLKFPEDNKEIPQNHRTRKGKSINFPENQYNRTPKSPKYYNYNEFAHYDQNNNHQNNNNKYRLHYYNNNQGGNNGYSDSNFNSNKYGINSYNDFNKYPANTNNNYYTGNNNNNGINNRYPVNNYNPSNNYNNPGYNQNYQNNNQAVNKYQNYNQEINKYQNNNQGVNNYPNNNKFADVIGNDDYYFDYQHNFYVKREKNNGNNYNNNANKHNNHNSNYYNGNKGIYYDNNKMDYYNNNKGNYYSNNNEENGVKTVYVVRGNGDPNNPEIVRVRPGQSVHK